MRTYDFIKDQGLEPRSKQKTVASVFIDPDGTVYSYGYHYPLAFKVNGLRFRNTAGYSSTTAKHISHAGSITDHDVELQYNTIRGQVSYDDVIKSLKAMYSTAVETEKATKRKDTKKNQCQVEEINKIYNTIMALNETLTV